MADIEATPTAEPIISWATDFFPQWVAEITTSLEPPSQN
jgi:hypothetical protein